jgi:sporulation protein YlmC with PRC-barrel domain
MSSRTPRLPLAAAAIAAALACGQAHAQQPAQPAPAPQSGSTDDTHLSVATVRMNGGLRASRVIGASVTNDHNDTIGTVDDLMLTQDNKVALAVISVGGFLGIGSKLVAVPYDQLQRGQNGKTVWPGASKQSLNDMPSFTYGG